MEKLDQEEDDEQMDDVENPEEEIEDSIKIQYADDSKEFKDKLLKLVAKGQQEAKGLPETDINLINKVKMDEYVENKKFLEEA